MVGVNFDGVAGLYGKYWSWQGCKERLAPLLNKSIDKK
jgi:hypothetical protein